MNLTMMDAEPSYTLLRTRFLETAKRHGARLEHHKHPLQGPQGEDLYTDVAVFARPGTRKWLVSVSGTHGVEGYYGSMCQSAYMDALAADGRLDGEVGLLLVHLINPWGTAWKRRTNEDNIDLNRNYLDFSRPLPQNPGYEAIHELFTLRDGQDEGGGQSDALWDAKVRELGRTQLMNVLGAGQYRHPDGLYYGGVEPSWSNTTLRAIVAQYLSDCSDAISFDLHTGAGDYGHPMLMAIAEREYPGMEDARRIYGPWLYTVLTGASSTTDTGISAAATGYTSQAMVDTMQGKRFTQLVIECGTYTNEQIRGSALWNDHFLHLRGELQGPVYEQVKRDLLEFFFPADADWREVVWVRTRQMFDRALNDLAARDQD
ncbi:M14 family metallopeptidase [Candidimonas humi]|uniref:DUF2817 domain-containing protein n=1 Tax=Candidimonas humi TaxID=683355 RepID=A0ABV8NWG6_9BURK|nr:DUF2817 domain-containing protein [Candidimonas humi]MBV6305791.1 M14 family metallopeptidase [Candidimonas humi]